MHLFVEFPGTLVCPEGTHCDGGHSYDTGLDRGIESIESGCMSCFQVREESNRQDGSIEHPLQPFRGDVGDVGLFFFVGDDFHSALCSVL